MTAAVTSTQLQAETISLRSVYILLWALAVEHQIKEVHDQTVCPYCWMDAHPEAH